MHGQHLCFHSCCETRSPEVVLTVGVELLQAGGVAEEAHLAVECLLALLQRLPQRGVHLQAGSQDVLSAMCAT